LDAAKKKGDEVAKKRILAFEVERDRAFWILEKA
jgi:hypothetical protein